MWFLIALAAVALVALAADLMVRAVDRSPSPLAWPTLTAVLLLFALAGVVDLFTGRIA